MIGSSPTSPLRGRYLVRNRGWNAYLRACDAVLGAFVSRAVARPFDRAPERLLLAIGGQLGDAVIATAALAAVKRGLPRTKIGIVTGSWSVPVFDGNPDVRWVHTVDHWKLDRSGRSVGSKVIRHRQMAATAVREIRARQYDAAIDLYAYYPNMAWLLWRAGIPVRAGYRSGGYGPLYTHAFDWSNGDEHTAQQHVRLVRSLFGTEVPAEVARYALPPVMLDVAQRAEAVLRGLGVVPGAYALVHMGAGTTRKEWPRWKWREIVESLTQSGTNVLLTGTGGTQARAARELAVVPGCFDAVDRFTWSELVYAVSKARFVAAVDTVVGHVAAAVDVPCVSLMTGMSNPAHWRPLGSSCVAITHHVPCAPCYRSRGCATMDCIRGITTEQVLEGLQTVESLHRNARTTTQGEAMREARR